MLFAEKIIMVEGIAEELLIPILAEYEGISLADNHVAVLQVGGRYFEHFLHLFDLKNPSAINRKVACITDIDPVRKKKDARGATMKTEVSTIHSFLYNNIVKPYGRFIFR